MTEYVGTKAAERINGGSGDDILLGKGGADTLDGRAGGDILVGGAGDDTYEIDTRYGPDRIVEHDDGGSDTVRLTGGSGSFRLGANIETLDISNWWGDRVIGNDEANLITGAPDPLIGSLQGSIFGKGGNDTVMGGLPGETLNGGDGDDTITALTNTTLVGGSGDDVLTSAIAGTRFTGGEGADTFRLTYGLMSLIVDFNAADGDVIDIESIDADLTLEDDQDFQFVDEFDGHAGEAVLDYNAKHDLTRLYVDANSDGDADTYLQMRGYIDGADGWVL